MDKVEIGTFLNNIRIEKNLSQQQMADLAGFTRRQQIMEIEQAKTDYGITTFLKALEALGLTLSIQPITLKEVQKVGRVKRNDPTPQVTTLFDFSKVKSAKETD